MYTLQQSSYRSETLFQTFQIVTLIEKQHLLVYGYGIQADCLLYWEMKIIVMKKSYPFSLQTSQFLSLYSLNAVLVLS